jgi:hypothetical protein
VRWGRRIISEACGEETRGDGGAQRGCARTGRQGVSGRSEAAPVQGGRACRGAARLRPHRAAGRVGAQRGCARTGGGQGSRHGGAQRGLRPHRAARLRPHRRAAGRGDEAVVYERRR